MVVMATIGRGGDGDGSGGVSGVAMVTGVHGCLGVVGVLVVGRVWEKVCCAAMMVSGRFRCFGTLPRRNLGVVGDNLCGRGHRQGARG